MTTHVDPHPIAHLAHTPPILSVPFDPRPPDAGADEPAVDLKSCFNTL